MSRVLFLKYILLYSILLFSEGISAQMDFKLFKADSVSGEVHYARSMMPNEYECKKTKIPYHYDNITVQVPEYRKIWKELIIPHPNFEIDWEKYDLETIELIIKPEQTTFEMVSPRGDSVTTEWEKLPNSQLNWELEFSAKSYRHASVWKWMPSSPRYYTKIKIRDTTHFDFVVKPEKKTFFQYLKPKNINMLNIAPHLKRVRIPCFVRTGQTHTKTIRHPGISSFYEICNIKRKGGEVRYQEVLSNKQAQILLPDIKEALQKMGYLPGSSTRIDNDFIVAMTQFQKENSLPVGQFDKRTLDKLGISCR